MPHSQKTGARFQPKRYLAALNSVSRALRRKGGINPKALPSVMLSTYGRLSELKKKREEILAEGTDPKTLSSLDQRIHRHQTALQIMKRMHVAPVLEGINFRSALNQRTINEFLLDNHIMRLIETISFKASFNSKSPSRHVHLFAAGVRSLKQQKVLGVTDLKLDTNLYMGIFSHLEWIEKQAHHSGGGLVEAKSFTAAFENLRRQLGQVNTEGKWQ